MVKTVFALPEERAACIARHSGGGFGLFGCGLAEEMVQGWLACVTIGWSAWLLPEATCVRWGRAATALRLVEGSGKGKGRDLRERKGENEKGVRDMSCRERVRYF